jgi:molybdate transport system regulatory protein
MPSTSSLSFRLRVVCGEDVAFGPGKAELLTSLLQTGSLNQSAKAMEMSYVKALGLVRDMNNHFQRPLVELSRGGKDGGGTVVTEAGRKVLETYVAMCEASERAAQPGWRKLRRMLKPAGDRYSGCAT